MLECGKEKVCSRNGDCRDGCCLRNSDADRSDHGGESELHSDKRAMDCRLTDEMMWNLDLVDVRSLDVSDVMFGCE